MTAEEQRIEVRHHTHQADAASVHFHKVHLGRATAAAPGASCAERRALGGEEGLEWSHNKEHQDRRIPEAGSAKRFKILGIWMIDRHRK